jgi:hypothetical protein
MAAINDFIIYVSGTQETNNQQDLMGFVLTHPNLKETKQYVSINIDFP